MRQTYKREEERERRRRENEEALHFALLFIGIEIDKNAEIISR